MFSSRQDDGRRLPLCLTTAQMEEEKRVFGFRFSRLDRFMDRLMSRFMSRFMDGIQLKLFNRHYLLDKLQATTYANVNILSFRRPYWTPPRPVVPIDFLWCTDSGSTTDQLNVFGNFEKKRIQIS